MVLPTDDSSLLTLFSRLGAVVLLGFAVGLEREMSGQSNPHTGIRDFIIFGLLGAVSGLAAVIFENAWVILFGFLGVFGLVAAGYWITVTRDREADPGITTEVAAIMTFFLGLLAISGALTLAIAVGITMLALLSQKGAIRDFRHRVQKFELTAALQFLIITFIVLPVLPDKALDAYFTMPIGKVVAVEADRGVVRLAPNRAYEFRSGAIVDIYSADTGRLGSVTIGPVTAGEVAAHIEGDAAPDLQQGMELRGPMGVQFITTLLSAINPYKVWLIVVLVSFVSFVGYVLIKVIGAGAGIGMTGLIGGLASSTVTTLSFARRSLEMPSWNRNFAVAVILASSVMFPRLLLQIGIVNQALMKNIAVPVLVMGAAGLAMAAFYYLRGKWEVKAAGEMNFSNPFSLKSALAFGAVFASVLMLTQVAIFYLGDTWLPVIAIVSGLTDADAIAFSLSYAEQAGAITRDWASFNLVLGALSNTFMKLFLVYALGHRGLFRNLLAAFLVIGATGMVTMYFYYDF